MNEKSAKNASENYYKYKILKIKLSSNSWTISTVKYSDLQIPHSSSNSEEFLSGTKEDDESYDKRRHPNDRELIIENCFQLSKIRLEKYVK